jgi:hypothetical protein
MRNRNQNAEVPLPVSDVDVYAEENRVRQHCSAASVSWEDKN